MHSSGKLLFSATFCASNCYSVIHSVHQTAIQCHILCMKLLHSLHQMLLSATFCASTAIQCYILCIKLVCRVLKPLDPNPRGKRSIPEVGLGPGLAMWYKIVRICYKNHAILWQIANEWYSEASERNSEASERTSEALELNSDT